MDSRLLSWIIREPGGALTATRSMFMSLRESHCVGTCAVAGLAAPVQEASPVCVSVGECHSAYADKLLMANK